MQLKTLYSFFCKKKNQKYLYNSFQKAFLLYNHSFTTLQHRFISFYILPLQFFNRIRIFLQTPPTFNKNALCTSLCQSKPRPLFQNYSLNCLFYLLLQPITSASFSQLCLILNNVFSVFCNSDKFSYNACLLL